MIKVSPSCKRLIRDLARAGIQISLYNRKIKISDTEKWLTQRLRRRIAANHDELIVYPGTPPSRKITRIKQKNPDLLMVIPCGDALVAGAWDDGQPRAPSAVTMARKAAPKRVTG